MLVEFLQKNNNNKKKESRRKVKNQIFKFLCLPPSVSRRTRSQFRFLMLLAARVQDSFPELLLFCSSHFHSFMESE